MQKTFVETRNFTNRLADILDDDAYAALQFELLQNPDKGAVMPGCGGLRKLRVADPHRHKGKRGGARVVYIHIPETNWIVLLDIYGKNEKDDLDTDERRILKELARQLRQDAINASAQSGKRGHADH